MVAAIPTLERRHDCDAETPAKVACSKSVDSRRIARPSNLVRRAMPACPIVARRGRYTSTSSSGRFWVLNSSSRPRRHDHRSNILETTPPGYFRRLRVLTSATFRNLFLMILLEESLTKNEIEPSHHHDNRNNAHSHQGRQHL